MKAKLIHKLDNGRVKIFELSEYINTGNCSGEKINISETLKGFFENNIIKDKYKEELKKHLAMINNLSYEGLVEEFQKFINIKKAMISQPMARKSEKEIEETREKAIKALNEQGFDVVNTLFTDEWCYKEKMKERGVVHIPLYFLAKSIENMSLCDAVYFCKGWESFRGCRIEHRAAVAYGLKIIYEQ